jgi:hypothetical protein
LPAVTVYRDIDKIASGPAIRRWVEEALTERGAKPGASERPAKSGP